MLVSLPRFYMVLKSNWPNALKILIEFRHSLSRRFLFLIPMILTILVAYNISVVSGQEEAQGYKLVWRYQAGNVVSVLISADGNYALAILPKGWTEKLLFFNNEGKLLWEREYEGQGAFASASISKDGERILLLSSTCSDLLCITENFSLILLNKHGDILYYGFFVKARSVSLIPSDTTFLIAVDRNSIFEDEPFVDVYTIDAGKPKLETSIKLKASIDASHGFFSYVKCISLSERGNYMLIAWNYEGDNDYIDLYCKEGDHYALLWRYKNQRSRGLSGAVSADGNYVGILRTTLEISEIWFLNNHGELLWKKEYPWSWPESSSISISKDGSYLAIIAPLDWPYDAPGIYLFSREGEKILQFCPLKFISASISEDKERIVATDSEVIYFFESLRKIAQRALERAQFTISQEKSKGFIATKAESLLLQAKDVFEKGNYTLAESLAAQALSSAVDVDEDGVLNEHDFLPYFNNYYIYFSLIIAPIIIALLIRAIRIPSTTTPTPSRLPSVPPSPPPPTVPSRKLPQPIPVEKPLEVGIGEWPTPDEYDTVIQNPNIFFTTPELKNCVVIPIKKGNMVLWSHGIGAAAVIYKVSYANKNYALRCFFAPKIKDIEKHYKEISEFLANKNIPIIIEFKYYPNEILLKGKRYPTLLMEWVDGELLNDYVKRNRSDRQAILRLADNFLEGMKLLKKHHIAHGDLQHGNIIIQRDGSIKLIDYDCMYIPSFKGEESPEVGHPCYNHPRRSNSYYCENLDNFSILVIYLSLLAIAENPGLWDLYNDDDNLIFTENDFKHPERSQLLEELKRSSNQKIRKLASLLEEACKKDLDEVPDIRELF